MPTRARLARGLRALGIGPGDRVALLSSTCPEWTLADCAVLAAGATVVPIYHTNSPEECGYVLAHSEARVVICEDAAQLAKIAAVRGDCPALEHVIVMRPTRTPTAACRSTTCARAARDVDPALLDDAQHRARARATSRRSSTRPGTTGPPKGCMITHGNFLAMVRMYEDVIDFGDATRSIFMFLPLAHSLARVAQMVALDIGGDARVLAGRPARCSTTCARRTRRTCRRCRACSRRSTRAALGGAEETSRVKRALFAWALATGAAVRAAERAGRRRGRCCARRHALADRLVLSKVRALFGGRLRARAHRRGADRRARCSSSSTPAACRSSRATA